MFLHSPAWREFQERVGRKTYSFRNGSYAIKMELPFGKNYLYTPYLEAIEIWDELERTATTQQSIFAKCEPMQQDEAAASALRASGFRHTTKALQPQRTIVVDIQKGEAELLASMRPKTRYNIRLSQRKGVAVQQEGSLAPFVAMLAQTAVRDGFRAHDASYYEGMLAIPGVSLFVARTQQGKAAAAAIVIEHEGVATYLHGASAYEYRATMAPFALHGHIMRHVAQKGVHEYDLWGIDKVRWPGVTRFKQGFGGREVSYIGSYDFSFSAPWYTLYRLKNRLR